MEKDSDKAIIIGAGIAGIAAAIRLAVRGYSVTVFEAGRHPGGKLSEIKSDGFRFDAGPSLFTMPQYVDELFTLAGKDPREHYKYLKLDKVCKYFFEDGARINAYADLQKFAAEVEHHTQDTKESVLNFLDKSAEIYHITDPVFLQRSLHKWKNYFNKTTLRSLLRFSRIDAFRTMNQANSSKFADSKTIRLFNRYATYNGSNPYQAPATLNVIPHFEQHFGAYFPEGGMYSIIRALTNLAIDCGVKFQFETYIDQIVLDGKKAKGVRSGQSMHPADIIVSNMDIWYTYRTLLKHVKAPENILGQERSSSALIFYWGISGSFPELDLHNIFFTEDYEDEFRQIWERKDIAMDPTIYLNISSKIEKSDAPPGKENWFTMINVPSNSGQNWDKLIESARNNIIAKLTRILNREIETLIVSEQILDPRKIDSQTFSFQGSLYGSSSNSQFAAFLRHANFSSKIEGLYFAGGSVHPGGGIPLALLSAKIVDELVK
ncbi:1-hydroxycarotenoid 3,4-desaturase CrtD [Daejeonella lutea]|uniref:Phytoene desaturase n=1 Tax=Daejeonella lutea TaxID=572036 RepID=A0A1T5CS99_9SPHI|nr:1-hydroxycarotenoid 3,4-desaturase CrtD [Daejeonella lutea]SKB62355.1 phytoene desaturase [Daejeonella lutea]